MATAQDGKRVPVFNGRLLSLLCEGLCSNAYHLERKMRVGKLRAAGWSPDEVRSDMSGHLVATTHYESSRLTNVKAATVVVFYTCMVCSHERQFGVEEL
jgi:hypothetical protein